MSVLSISRKPRPSEWPRLSNPVMIWIRDRRTRFYTTSSTLRKTYPKIPADCYRNSSEAAITRCTERAQWKLRGDMALFKVIPNPSILGLLFTVAICWMPAGCFNGGAWRTHVKKPETPVYGLSQSVGAPRASPATTFKAACRNTGRRLSTFGRNPNPAGCLPGEISGRS